MSRRGASRKSSALRVGGVSTTTRSKSPLVVQLVQLLHRHVLLRARQRAGDVAVEAVGEDALGLLGSDSACLATRSSNVRLGVEHQGPQLARPVAVDLRLGVFVEPFEAERVGQPLGRVDRDDARAPTLTGRLRARCTAAVVVLPTPPEPVQTMISLLEHERQLARASLTASSAHTGWPARQVADAGEQPAGEHVDVGRARGRPSNR